MNQSVPEHESTEWLNALVFSMKSSGKLWVCLDPRNLNDMIKRRTPTIEEVTHKFNGATVFSKLDAKHGYWSVKLDKNPQG